MFASATIYGAFGGWIVGLLVSVFWRARYAWVLAIGLIGLSTAGFGVNAMGASSDLSAFAFGVAIVLGFAGIGVLAGIITSWFAYLFGGDF